MSIGAWFGFATSLRDETLSMDFREIRAIELLLLRRAGVVRAGYYS